MRFYQKQAMANQIDRDVLTEKLKRHKTFTYMIVHDIKHPTESLIKIQDHLQEALNTYHLDNVLAMITEMQKIAERPIEVPEIKMPGIEDLDEELEIYGAECDEGLITPPKVF